MRQEEVLMQDGLLAGRSEQAGLRLDDPSVSRNHVRFTRVGHAWIVEDLASRGGTYLNGHLFQREVLAAGDMLGIGPFLLRFDGRKLSRVEGLEGISLTAENLVTTRSGHRLLDGVSLSVAPGQFVGILGPSGAGKSTLLDALCGLRPPDSGTVTADGWDLLQGGVEVREALGYVPQDDIVPAELVSNPKNTALLVGQPILIALLVAWVSRDPGLQLFFAYVATLWFGCGNAAKDIVRELPMFRRERLIGLGRTSYLLAKFLVLGALTCLQAVLLYGVLQWVSGGVGGAMGWQLAALVATAGAAVAIGLAISAWARSALQAVMVVPLILIPQILFSGFVVPAGDLRTAPFLVSRAMPSAAAQEVMDVSLFWGRTISGAMRVDFPASFSNLNRDRSLKNGMVFLNAKPAIRGLTALGMWMLAGLVTAWLFLRIRERG